MNPIGLVGICSILISFGGFLRMDVSYAAQLIPDDCRISFTTIGSPVAVNIEGKSGLPCEGFIDIDQPGSSVLTLDLSQLDTGLPSRNKHLRENYLEISKFPKASLFLKVVDDLRKQVAGEMEASKSSFQGELELHGQRKSIFDGRYNIKNGRLIATFSFLFPDYGMEQPTFMGITIVDRVNVNVEMRFHEK